jgi:hypothetical protein
MQNAIGKQMKTQWIILLAYAPPDFLVKWAVDTERDFELLNSFMCMHSTYGSSHYCEIINV